MKPYSQKLRKKSGTVYLSQQDKTVPFLCGKREIPVDYPVRAEKNGRVRKMGLSFDLFV